MHGMQDCTVCLHATGLWPQPAPVCTAGTYLTAGSEGRDGTVLAWLEERLAAASLLPAANGEAFNVLRYEPGQHYDSHMDSFDPKVLGGGYGCGV